MMGEDYEAALDPAACAFVGEARAPRCCHVWPRLIHGGEDPAQCHNGVHLPSAVGARSFPVRAVQGVCAVSPRHPVLPQSGDPRLRLSPFAKRSRTRTRTRARTRLTSLNPCLGRKLQNERAIAGRRGNQRASGRAGRDRAPSIPLGGLCGGGAGSQLPAPGGGSGASNQAAGSRPSACPAGAARPAD